LSRQLLTEQRLGRMLRNGEAFIVPVEGMNLGHVPKVR
jgi:hypothetical protein